MDENCLFCKIVSGAIPATKVHEDDTCIAFNDITPQAPTHILIIPREHVDSLDTATAVPQGNARPPAAHRRADRPR